MLRAISRKSLTRNGIIRCRAIRFYDYSTMSSTDMDEEDYKLVRKGLLRFPKKDSFPSSRYSNIKLQNIVQFQQSRNISSLPFPDSMSNFTFWGGAGWMIHTLHLDGTIPYWICMSLCAVTVRTALLPVVIQGAHTSAKFAAIAPEVQFLLSLFQNDLKMLQQSKETQKQRQKYQLFGLAWRNLSAIYKKYDFHPLSIFKAPLMQIPFFFYFAADLRKVIDGRDIDLARALQDGGILWFNDLTEADPYFVLPVLTGTLLYMNVEIATSKRGLSGETASQANFVKFLKDFFQSKCILKLNDKRGTLGDIFSTQISISTFHRLIDYVSLYNGQFACCSSNLFAHEFHLDHGTKRSSQKRQFSLFSQASVLGY